MIVQTRFRLEEDGWELVRTYSSRGMMIRQDESGELYSEAVDPAFAGRTYTETDIPAEEEAGAAEEILDILLGGGEA